MSAPSSALDLAIIMFDFGPTGVVRNALRIARACSGAGMRVALWVAQDAGSMRSEVPPGVAVEAFGTPLGANYSRGQRRRQGKAAVPRLAALIGRERPRVILSAGNHFHSAAASAKVAADVPGKLLLRISTGLPRPDGHNVYEWLRYWNKRRKAIRRQAKADLLIAVSRQVAEELQGDMGVAPDRIVTIPNGIDLAAIAARGAEPFSHSWFEPGQPPVILGVGRIDRYKNFELLIAAFARLRAEGPLRLMIVGEERNAWRHRLEALARRLGVAGDVRFEGFQPNPHAYFRRAAAYVCCSRYEGMSNAMLEAMANGCPVVATRTVTGAAELLDDGRLGPIAEPDANALAQAIAARIDAPRDSQALLDQAGLYSLDRTLATYVDLFKRLAA